MRQLKFVYILAVLLFSFSAMLAQGLAETYESDANKIISAAKESTLGWNRLTELTDTFGHRLSGSKALEDALDWILVKMEGDGFDNVHGEKVMVPRWVRGAESAEMLVPRHRKLPMLGLGRSIGTPRRGITAEVLVVSSFDDLTAKASQARGKIVLFNVPFTSYGPTVQYRSRGAVAAAKAGAVAALVRSVTPYSQQTPHTGAMGQYEAGVPKIPAAAITVEDAMMMQRMQDRGDKIIVKLKMKAQMHADTESRNVMAEIKGSEFPDEVIVLGGHIDSWDVGTGAMDDAGGCVAGWEAIRLIKKLGLTPRRTIRAVMWTNEENGLRGGNAYRDAHRDELDNHILAMESDAGVFKPKGFGFSGSEEALKIIQEIATLLSPIESDTVTAGGGGADIGPLMREGVPGMGLRVDGSKYFWYHHSQADTIDKLNREEFNLCVATMAVIAYVVADMPERLPRKIEEESEE